MWPITVGIARRRSGSPVLTRSRILVSRPKANNTTAVVWIAMVTTMSERPRLQLGRSTRLPYHRPHRQTATTTEVDPGSKAPDEEPRSDHYRVLKGIQLEGPAREVGGLPVEVSHGRLRDSRSVAVSGLGPCRFGIGRGGRHVVGGSHSVQAGSDRAQRGAVTVHDLR